MISRRTAHRRAGGDARTRTLGRVPASRSRIFCRGCGISVLVGIRGAAGSIVGAAMPPACGQNAAYFFDDPEEAGKWLRTFAQPGDAILFKGSRGTRVETRSGRVSRLNPAVCSTGFSSRFCHGYAKQHSFLTSRRSASSSTSRSEPPLRVSPRLFSDPYWPVADSQACASFSSVSTSAKTARIASQESRHADHGRPADHHLDRYPDSALGRSSKSLCVDCHVRAGRALAPSDSGMITRRSRRSATWD